MFTNFAVKYLAILDVNLILLIFIFIHFLLLSFIIAICNMFKEFHQIYLQDTGTEEKRMKHQAELAEKLNADARERLRGMKVGVDDKK